MGSQTEKRTKSKVGRGTKLNYYISDLHLRDQAIFDKCKRPFKNLEDMERAIISNWNNKVKKEDAVYVLGDIADNNPATIEIYRDLNGHKRLIVGNHDHIILEEIEKSGIFDGIKFIDIVEDANHKVCLCHYPLMDWMEFNRNGYLVYGHVHNKTEENGYAYKQIKEYYKNKPAYNCGVDVNDFTPVTLEEMIRNKEDCKDDPYIH